MRRMHWSWRELLETPAPVLEALELDMQAEAEAAETLNRWRDRQG